MPDTTATTPPLPSITDLGRRLAALNAAFDREDGNKADSKLGCCATWSGTPEHGRHARCTGLQRGYIS